MASYVVDYFELESGRINFLHLIGVADLEIEFAKEHGSAELRDRLASAGMLPITQPDRSELPLD